MAGNNLLLFGCDFLPRRQPSELAFWQDAVQYLRAHFDRVAIVSINNRPVPSEQLGSGVELFNLPPRYPGNSGDWSDPEYSGQRFHDLPKAVLYKTWTLRHHLDGIGEIIRSREIGVVHYLRIFGIFNRMLTSRHPDVVFSMTVPTHIDRGFPLHYPYHLIKLLGYRGMDLLVPTCAATATKLSSLGIDEARLRTIHWSFEPEADEVSAERRSEMMGRLGLDPGQPVVLWSGPLQDTGEDELSWSLEVARQASREPGRWQFVFAFKPDRLSEHFKSLADDVPGVRAVETTRSDFDVLQSLAKVFLSPVCRSNRTVAPALTWIEMMQRSVPVLTTPVAGVDELIHSGENGFIARDAEEAAGILMGLSPQALERAGRKATQKVREDYDLSAIVDQYAAMWREACAGKRSDG